MIQVLFGPSKYRVLGVSFLDPCFFFFLISLMLKPKAKNKTLSISTNFEIKRCEHNISHYLCVVHAPNGKLGSTPQSSESKVKIWESSPSLSPRTKLVLLGHLLTYISLHTRLGVQMLGTAWEGVKHLRLPTLWTDLHNVLIGLVQIKSILK